MAIVNDIVDATTPQAAVAATRKALELSGVVIADDVAARQGSAAGMYVSIDQLPTLAFEAQQRATLSRLTFRELAETLAGVAALPAGVPIPVVPTGAPDTVQLKLRDQPARLAGFVTAWVNSAVKYHGSADAKEVALTNAPLLLAALALRQEEPVDLRSAFLPGKLRLGALDTTLLIAGLRATMLAARRDVPAAPTGSPPGSSPSPSPHSKSGGASIASVTQPKGAGIAAVPATAGDECAGIAEYLNGYVPAGDLASFTYGEALKGYLGEFVTNLAKGTQVLEERLGVFFEGLGIIARLWAFILLYKTVEVKTEVSPNVVHKGADQTTTVTAKVTAGIPEQKWNEFKKDVEQSPIWTKAMSCAKALSLPFITDYGDIAGAMKNWRAQWEIEEGRGEHALFPIRDGQFSGRGAVLGRFVRPLMPEGDHKATDSITVNITPEKASDHPGELREAWVLVCSKVETDEPPNLKTLLGAGVSGSGSGGMPISSDAQKVASAGGKLFGPAAIASLTATIVELLAGFVQNVVTFDSCGRVKVGYHKPKPGKWSGTITIESERSEQFTYAKSGTTKYPARGGGQLSVAYNRHEETRSTVRFEEVLTVRGDDVAIRTLPAGQETPIVLLDASQASQGFNEFIASKASEGLTGSGCLVNSASVSEYSGTFSFRSDDARVTLRLSPDGSYALSYSVARGPEEDLNISGIDASLVEPTGQAFTTGLAGAALVSTKSCVGSNTSRAGTKPVVLIGPEIQALTGRLDPKNPGDRIEGKIPLYNEQDGSSSIVRWDLRHEGPIRFPTN